VVNAGADQTVTLPAGVSLSGSAGDDGLPNPPGALSATWSKVSGPGTVTFGNANALNTTASFGTAGAYVLRLTASDSLLSSSDDVAVTVNPAGTPGSLAGSRAPSPASVDLAAEGTADWAHWGLTSAADFNRKSGIAQQISNYARVGTGAIQRYTANPTLFGWSGGAPTASATNVDSGLWVMGVGNGYQITVPADTTTRTLKVYVGVCFTRGQFEAALSDASAPAYLDASLIDQAATTNGVYTLVYRAASSGQTLTVRWTETQTFNFWGNVTFQAATLR
jgi:hypothetical protein